MKSKKKITRYVQKDLPRQAGKMAVDEFRENFRRQGFRNNGITPWPEVERRKKRQPMVWLPVQGRKAYFRAVCAKQKDR